jgi:predicted 3-demethylubiquinone-9 3-methyltransferase (glyoxalase superfamily)
MHKITPFLWFEGNIEDIAKFYTSVFKDSEIISMSPGTGFSSATVRLNNQELILFNAGPMFKLTEATSLFINVETQEDVDYYWNTLIADGGQESRCGWLKDKYGLSWQVIPSALSRMMGDKDREKAGRAMQAMMQMNKIIIADLEKAYQG